MATARVTNLTGGNKQLNCPDPLALTRMLSHNQTALHKIKARRRKHKIPIRKQISHILVSTRKANGRPFHRFPSPSWRIYPLSNSCSAWSSSPILRISHHLYRCGIRGLPNRPLSRGATLSLRRIKNIVFARLASPRHEFSAKLAVQKQSFLFS